jgi:hypothetical protein
MSAFVSRGSIQAGRKADDRPGLPQHETPTNGDKLLPRLLSEGSFHETDSV